MILIDKERGTREKIHMGVLVGSRCTSIEFDYEDIRRIYQMPPEKIKEMMGHFLTRFGKERYERNSLEECTNRLAEAVEYHLAVLAEENTRGMEDKEKKELIRNGYFRQSRLGYALWEYKEAKRKKEENRGAAAV